jgi:hypothetical protein
VKSVGRYLIIPLLAAVLALPLIQSAPVFASPGLSVSKTIVKVNVPPGESKGFTMTVGNSAGDPTTDIMVEVMGLGQNIDGTYQELTETDDRSPYSARSFISVTPDEFQLSPGGSQEVTVSIDVPDNVGSGGRYAVIYTHSKPAGQGNVGIASAIGTTIVLTVSDTELKRAGSITDFSVAEIASGEPVGITATIENTGNYHYKAQAKALLKDESGIELSTASTPITGCSIIPTYSYEFEASLAPDQELKSGTYYVDLEMALEDGTVLDSETKSFEITGTYVPPGVVAGGISTLPTTNWVLIIGGFAGGCILTALVLWLLMRRKLAS